MNDGYKKRNHIKSNKTILICSSFNNESWNEWLLLFRIFLLLNITVNMRSMKKEDSPSSAVCFNIIFQYCNQCNFHSEIINLTTFNTFRSLNSYHPSPTSFAWASFVGRCSTLQATKKLETEETFELVGNSLIIHLCGLNVYGTQIKKNIWVTLAQSLGLLGSCGDAIILLWMNWLW